MRSEFKKTISIALPISLGQVGHMLTQVADTVMLGHYNPMHLAAATFAFSVFVPALVLVIGFTVGVTPPVSAADGRGDFKEMAGVFVNGLWMNMAFGILFYLALISITPLMSYMGQDPIVVELGIPYFYVLSLSALPIAVFQFYKQFAEGLSKTKVAMYVSLIGNILNIGLNYVFIFGKYGMPEMGIMGAGWATFISRVAMAVSMMIYVHKDAVFQPVFDFIKRYTINWDVIKKLFFISLPISMQMLMEAGAFVFVSVLIGTHGAGSLAAHQISLSMAAMAYMFATGIASATTVRVGNQRGLKSFEGVKKVVKTSLILIFIYEAITATLFFSFRNEIPFLFVAPGDTAIISLATKLLIITAVFQVSDGIQVTLMGVLRGLEDVKIPMYIAFFSYWIVALSVGYYLAEVKHMATPGYWWGLVTGLTVSGILLTIRYLYLLTRKSETFIESGKSPKAI